MTHQKVAIVGHSLVWWFEDFIRHDSNITLHLGLANTEVRCILTGVKMGLVIDNWHLIRNSLIQFAPDVIILILGDNDLFRTEPEDVAANLLRAGHMLKGWTGGSKIILFYLFSRFWTTSYCYFSPAYNQEANWVNTLMRQGVQNLHRTFTWSFHGPSFFEQRAFCYFADEGVHLNTVGQVMLFRAMLRAIHVFRFF